MRFDNRHFACQHIKWKKSKILETNPKSGEFVSFYPHIFAHLQTFIAKCWAELPCCGYDNV